MYKIIFFGFAILSSNFVLANNNCHPNIPKNQNNYIIGYGSLMENASRLRTNPDANNVYPLNVKGFKRVWGIHGGNYKITFLTTLKDSKGYFNAVYYKVSPDDFLNVDEREGGYCRTVVPISTLSALGSKSLPKGKFWLYVNKKNKIQRPSATYPIVQSYVDIFLNGCLEVQDKYKLENFAKNCIDTTKDWPKSNTGKKWLNDRIYARRPFTLPNVFRIDKLLLLRFSYYHNIPKE